MIALAMALAGLVYLFGIPGVLDSPWQLSTKRADLENSVTNLRQENVMLQQYAPRIADLRRQDESLAEQLVLMRRIIPQESLSEEFLATLRKDAAATGVLLRDTAPQPVIRRDFYGEVPFQLRVEGNVGALLAFCNRLEREPRLASISRFSVRPVTEGNTSDYRATRLDATVGVTTYFASAF